MRAILDRIEDGIAVLELENGKTWEIPSQYLEDFKEGDEVVITFSKDEKTTDERESKIKQKLSGLFDN